MNNISKRKGLLKFILLTISISSLSTFAKINNFYPYEINKKVKTQIRITKSNAKENLTLKISQLDEILKKDNDTLKVIESQIEQSKNILNSHFQRIWQNNQRAQCN